MFTQSAGHGRAHQPFWRQRGWLLAAAFLLLTVLVSVVAAVTGQDDGRRASDTAASGPLSARPTDPAKRPGTCRTDDRSTAPPTAAPKDVRWKTVAESRIPVSPSAGPTLSSGPVLWCFAHTPTGAVMAAHVIPAQMNTPHWQTVVEQQVMPGLGREIFASQRASLSEPTVRGRAAGTYAGFALSRYDGSTATVVLLVKSAKGSLTTSSVTMRWDGGDWKVQPEPNGALHSAADTVGTSDGFIQWEA
ncbi:hypothetical protein ACWDE9_13865 [Streptomyces olivaceoviridis]